MYLDFKSHIILESNVRIPRYKLNRNPAKVSEG
jgi:hypothetical protein